MYKPPVDLIKKALEEDGAFADITTLSTVPEDQWSEARVLARKPGVVAGIAVAIEVFRQIDERIQIQQLVQDGALVRADENLLLLQGPARSVLSAERVALNFLGRLSGVATLTAQCVRAIEGSRTRIIDTRKTTPGLRALEKMAVQLGGGHNHRFGLNDGVLIKDNHIKAAGSIAAAVAGARQMAPHLLKIEVECETLAEVRTALDAGADVILLDNMTVEQMSQAVEVIRRAGLRVLIEASGDIGTDAERLNAVAATGVDFISLGALTHSAPNFNISLEFA
ncbi:carboxylating nicotinate-nucleotide diphosphorylase [Dictyobacter formicarum]|uniref:nicotinate-nucleotide diphosphorylase (carboxylating) n=1 Tax=Dictyobacter formicarum TaxID=2778368 RepID=A0ABQ3VKD1_9CHLR|nr:carboxylating nicotinate-nucleotide diphosphorylase [Dictyobacter formicarum]GHO86139.1 nicotinate-nucleotide diphosphorylase (carboxylating) [Dictyobacter formicarum]